MNEHEVDLLAGAIHLARPDWPLKSLRTFIASKLGARPYRDAFVALAWVACEPNSHTPARVLEAGPWWRAAAVDGGNVNPRDPFDPAAFCGICGKHRIGCDRTPNAEHVFIRADEFRAGNGAPRPAELTTTVPVRGAEQHTTQEADK